MRDRKVVFLAGIPVQPSAQAMTLHKDGLNQRFMEGIAYGPQGGLSLEKSLDQLKTFGTRHAGAGVTPEI